MADDLGIMNDALMHLGSNYTIGAVNERSPEAAACRQFYWKVVREVMQVFPYAFGTEFKALTPLMSPTVNAYGPVTNPPAQPTPEFGYAYQYPVDCLHIHRLLSAGNNVPQALLFDGAQFPGWPWGYDSTQSRIPFKIAMNDNQPGTLWILCQWPSLWAEYSSSKVPPNLYPPSFERAVALLLAFYIGPKLARTQQELIQGAKVNFDAIVLESRINSVNEQQDPVLPESELIRTRSGYGLWSPAGAPWASFPGGFSV